jgi:hypothetical protein
VTELLVDRAPRVRCYECGSEDIFSVCHHCQRPMCDDHSPYAFRQGGELVRRPSGSADEARPASQELAGLGLGGQNEVVYHCADHDHMVRGFPIRWVAAGAGVAVLGILLMCVAAKLGLVLLLIGAPMAGIAFALHQRSVTSAVRPPLPFVQQVNTVDFAEVLSGYVRLDNGEYTSTVDSVVGEMAVDVLANDAHTKLTAYRKKFRLAESEPVYCTGGFLMVEGAVGLAFRAGQTTVLSSGTGISFGGEFAHGRGSPGDSKLALGYEVYDDRRPHEIPLWIVPSLVPASSRRTLEIDLHWNRLGPDDEPLSLTMFELIELEVPAAWGNLERSAPERVEIGRSADLKRRVIRWRQVRPDAGSLTLTLRFERPITELPESQPLAGDPARPGDDGTRSRLTLAGRLEATFDGLLSGVTGVGVYLPGGGSAHVPPTTTQTKVNVTFDAGLGSIRYQDERVVPDDKHPDDAERIRLDEVYGVVPDHRTVADLTNAISVDNYYVKSVVEHPPHGDDGRTGVLNRVWDIAGRRYIGLFPIDFAINLRGEEAGRVNGFSGKTVAQVMVKGAYATGTVEGSTDSHGDELLTQIEDTWTSLHNRVIEILGTRANLARGSRSLPGPPESILHGEVIEPGRAVVDYHSGRVAELRERLKVADERFFDGLMSEDAHRRMTDRIQAEIDELRGRS